MTSQLADNVKKEKLSEGMRCRTKDSGLQRKSMPDVGVGEGERRMLGLKSKTHVLNFCKLSPSVFFLVFLSS